MRLLGGLFVLIGVVIMVSGLQVDRYHNLMHLIWGLLALGVSFAVENDKALLHRFRSLLPDTGDSWHNDWEPCYAESVAGFGIQGSKQVSGVDAASSNGRDARPVPVA